ncbi:hypothetical protein EV363DRAFT_1440862 [Boletus edulis]|nr:hypothetical protein EV363DRAFT_1440862 [Boletus edulis]
MTASKFSFVSGIFGFAVTAISLLTLLTKVCRSHLPSNKIKALESLLDETEQFFENAVEEGLLTEPSFVQETELHIKRLKARTYGLRSRAFKATNLRQDCAEFLRGTSTAIDNTCQSLKKLRAQVVTSSEEGRSRGLVEMNPIPTSTPSVLICGPDSRRCLGRLPASKIPRPHSCPPALSTWRSHDALSTFAHESESLKWSE